MHLTLYRGAESRHPITCDDFEDWPEVVASLTDLVGRVTAAPEGASLQEQKESLLAFAPHRLKPRTTRALVNVLEVTMLVIDVDRCNVDVLAERLEGLDIDALMYTSPSDDPEGDPEARRVRVVAPISRPISVAECKQSRLVFAEALGLEPGCGVEGAPDASRLFFCGRLHDTPDRQVWVFGGAS